jgi:hypothetical protein
MHAHLHRDHLGGRFAVALQAHRLEYIRLGQALNVGDGPSTLMLKSGRLSVGAGRLAVR